LPVKAPVGTGTEIEPLTQVVGVAATPLNVTAFPAGVEPKPVPVIVTAVPVAPEAGDKPVTFGTTVNATPLLATLFTVTTTFPVAAPAGTGAEIDPIAQVVAVTATPLNVTVFPVGEEPKPVPAMVTVVPATPELGDKLVMVGTTVKATPLLGPPFTVTITFPVVASTGTDAAIDVVVQMVDVAGTPLNVNFPVAAVPKPVPLTVTDVPTTPDDTVRLLMTGKAVPLPVRVTVCGLLLALSVMVSVPGREPVAVGVKVTLTVQVAPAASDVPHVFV
jgi:hypothetical protein